VVSCPLLLRPARTTDHSNLHRAGWSERVEKSVNALRAALSLAAREHIALVGAGGKTSLLFTLAEELTRAGKRVITSTTTKIWHHQVMKAPCVVYTDTLHSWRDRVKEGLVEVGHVFVGRCVLESGKVDGINPYTSDRLFGDLEVDYLLLEADGAAGLPAKAPAAHEPVIPASATLVVAMIGLESVNRPLSSEVVFRLDEMKKITGLAMSMPLTTTALSRLFLHPKGLFKGSPRLARRIPFLNKLDLLKSDQDALELAGMILDEGKAKISRVLIGSIKAGRYRVVGVE
jgi:probable selenium-dependent hydroxylase accessory protein YqeC